MNPQDRYRLDSKALGAGGYAEVRGATAKETATRVALKRAKSRDHEAHARIRREIEVLRGLKHPNIVPLLDYDPDLAWYTMPIALGTLQDLRATMTESETLDAIHQTALGLSHAHDQRIVHRDITPSNILRIRLDAGERWVLADWGLVQTPRAGQPPITQRVLGTDGFRAPEAEHDKELTPAADVYALGRVLAWALTGDWPRPGIALLPHEPWRASVMRSTRATPSERQSLIEFIASLQRPSFYSEDGFVLEWTTDHVGQTTTRLIKLVANTNADVARLPGMYIGGSQDVFRLSAIERPAMLASRDNNGRITGWTGIELQETALENSRTGESTSLFPRRPALCADPGLACLERTSTCLGGLGPYVFMRLRDDYFGHFSAHPSWICEFGVYDVDTRAEVSALSPAALEALFQAERDQAVMSLAADGFSESEMGRVFLSMYWPLIEPDGTIGLCLQFSISTGHAPSDDAWSDYTVSTEIRTKTLPRYLQPHSRPPKAIKPSEAFAIPWGWSRVPPDAAARAWLEEAILEPESLALSEKPVLLPDATE